MASSSSGTEKKEMMIFMHGLYRKLMSISRGLKEPFENKEFQMILRMGQQMSKQAVEKGYHQDLHSKFVECIQNDIINQILPSLLKKDNADLLMELVKSWRYYKRRVQIMRDVFLYLDIHCVIEHYDSFDDIATELFLNLIYQQFVGQVREAVISMINLERNGQDINGGLVNSVLHFFVDIRDGKLDYYEKDIEKDILKDSVSYYTRKASKWILEDSYSEYLLKAEEFLKREAKIAPYLISDTGTKLLGEVGKELLSIYGIQLLKHGNNGFNALLSDCKVGATLARIYKMLSTIPQLSKKFQQIFNQHVIPEVMDLIKQAESASKTCAPQDERREVLVKEEQDFVYNVIGIHDKYLSYVNECSMNDEFFQKIFKGSFESLCNIHVAGKSGAELLAKFCDNLLKEGGSAKLSERSIEETLEKAVNLLVYIDEKDVFEEFYRNKLAWRFLSGKSADDEQESSILTKLKQNCGSWFTFKMEQMVMDLIAAKETKVGFEVHLAEHPNQKPGIDFNVTLLKTGFWPSFKSFDLKLKLPAEMVQCIQVFEKFDKRKLQWKFSLGTCHVNGYFDTKAIELVATPLQAATLLLFNASDRLSFLEVKSQLNISEDDDVNRLLESISCPTYQILNKDQDVFEFNSKFSAKERMIKIPPPPEYEMKAALIEAAYNDRRYAIDAAIIRIMKSRKLLEYQKLVAECVEQLKFEPGKDLLKKRLESLIDREYLQRDNGDPNSFKYLP
ncbi:ubiquitin-protein ligase [Lithospermum erythrorhizon]|uniref:Ubiquitin-protein ligase n=1 Tax=Lithospermum erythrorhizon TaxID=34254 RepID=A0AAV3RKB0_LITER